jgi:hypothetical protein
VDVDAYDICKMTNINKSVVVKIDSIDTLSVERFLLLAGSKSFKNFPDENFQLYGN